MTSAADVRALALVSVKTEAVIHHKARAVQLSVVFTVKEQTEWSQHVQSQTVSAFI